MSSIIKWVLDKGTHRFIIHRSQHRCTAPKEHKTRKDPQRARSSNTKMSRWYRLYLKLSVTHLLQREGFAGRRKLRRGSRTIGQGSSYGSNEWPWPSCTQRHLRLGQTGRKHPQISGEIGIEFWTNATPSYLQAKYCNMLTNMLTNMLALLALRWAWWFRRHGADGVKVRRKSSAGRRRNHGWRCLVTLLLFATLNFHTALWSWKWWLINFAA